MSDVFVGAQMRAWCVSLLAVVNDAYKLGTLLGAGAILKTQGKHALQPDILLMVHDAPALAINVINADTSKTARDTWLTQCAAAHVIEAWQIEADTARANMYQADAAWSYELIQPDRKGVYYSAINEELFFPVRWFKQQPTLWQMMEYWGMID